jgi:transcriptional regulator with XRE-family HTH domain
MVTTAHEIGATLQRLRQAAGLSLRTLAVRAGFSASFLSQVENGLTSPSIASLEKLASTLDLRLLDFFEELESQPAASGRSPRWRPLTSEWSRSRMEPLAPRQGRLLHLDGILLTVHSGGRSGKEPSPSPSEQLVFVLEGCLRLTLGEDVLVLERDDAATITAGRAYRWENPGDETTRVLLVSAR